MFLITTTGTLGTVIFDDLGERSFSHPISNYDLQEEYDIYELTESDDIQSAIDNGYITVSNGVSNITNLSNFFMQNNVFDSDGDNIVDDSEELDGFSSSYYLDAGNLTGGIPLGVISNSPLVASVNGATGIVSIDTSDIPENTNLYYTDTRARTSITGATGINYNSTTGEIIVDATAEEISYSAATPSNWVSNPPEVKSALDEISSRVTIIEGGGGVTTDAQISNSGIDQTTSSNLWNDMPNMILTTSNSSDRKYLILFSATFTGSSGKKVEVRIVVDGVVKTGSVRTHKVSSNNSEFTLASQDLTGVLSDGKVIKVQWRKINNGGTITVGDRNLIIYSLENE